MGLVRIFKSCWMEWWRFHSYPICPSPQKLAPGHRGIELRFASWPSIWVNYNDLTVLPSPGIMVYFRGIIPKWPIIIQVNVTCVFIYPDPCLRNFLIFLRFFSCKWDQMGIYHSPGYAALSSLGRLVCTPLSHLESLESQFLKPHI